MENHFTESGEATFLALSLLVYFRESLHEISRESLLLKKLFGRAPAGFSTESALGGLPNKQGLICFQLSMCLIMQS